MNINERDMGIEIVMNTLKSNKFGLSISEISRKSGMNRNSVAKYLSILVTLGQVEMQIVGPARVYHLSSRIPISAAALNQFPDPVVSINEKKIIHKVNGQFEKIFGIKNIELENTLLEKAKISVLQKISQTSDYSEAFLGVMPKDGSWKSFEDDSSKTFYWLTPAVFEDGSTGVVIALRKTK